MTLSFAVFAQTDLTTGTAAVFSLIGVVLVAMLAGVIQIVALARRRRAEEEHYWITQRHAAYTEYLSAVTDAVNEFINDGRVDSKLQRRLDATGHAAALIALPTTYDSLSYLSEAIQEFQDKAVAGRWGGLRHWSDSRLERIFVEMSNVRSGMRRELGFVPIHKRTVPAGASGEEDTFSELRIHGVSGTLPEDTLYTDPVGESESPTATVIFSRREFDRRFETRAFRWANLTSGGRRTAFWILLGPFALANVAGWMAGWKMNANQPPPAATDGDPWHMMLGRFGVRATGLALTALFVIQALTAAVVLPFEWLQSEAKMIFGFNVDIGQPMQKASLSFLFLLVAALFYWLVARVSARSHFPEVDGKRGLGLLLDPTGSAMIDATTEYGSSKEDPAGASITDNRLWTVHLMLHRLRRLHFAAGTTVIGLAVMVSVGFVPGWLLIAILALLILVFSWMTTYAPRNGLSWFVTATVPLASVLLFIVAIVIVWRSETSDWVVDEIHIVAFGIAALLGVFGFLSWFAGPLSVGALVLATFFGAVLGTSIGLVIDAVLRLDTLVDQGVGWVAVAMLALLAWLMLVAVALLFVGRRGEADGNTAPLPSSLGAKLKVLGRRVELEVRVLFWAAAAFGLATLLRLGWLVWSHGSATRTAQQLPTSGVGGFWQSLLAGLDPAALDDFPSSLITTAVAIAILVPAYFAFRSIRKGFGKGDASTVRRRQVGILWDLSSFWPRWFHPLAPPSYGPRAIKDLTLAIQEMPECSVLGAHSQGSLIAAVCMQQSQEARPFITYGSQLGILYPRMFPMAGFPGLVDDLATLAPSWVNLWRRTDPIGGHYVSCENVYNLLVSEGVGHSGYEITDDYRRVRTRAVGLWSVRDPMRAR